MQRVGKDARERIQTMELKKKVKGDCLIIRSWDAALADDDIKLTNVETKTLETISKYIDSLTAGDLQQDNSLAIDNNPLQNNFETDTDAESSDQTLSIQSNDVDPTMLTAISDYIDNIAINRDEDAKTSNLKEDIVINNLKSKSSNIVLNEEKFLKFSPFANRETLNETEPTKYLLIAYCQSMCFGKWSFCNIFCHWDCHPFRYLSSQCVFEVWISVDFRVIFDELFNRFRFFVHTARTKNDMNICFFFSTQDTFRYHLTPSFHVLSRSQPVDVEFLRKHTKTGG